MVVYGLYADGEDHHTRVPFRQLVEKRRVDVVQPDLHWCGGMTEAIKIYHIAEAAGIKSSPHGGLNSAYGQHFCYAMPDCTLSEFHLSTPAGIPLAEVAAMPGVPVPKDSYLVPSDLNGKTWQCCRLCRIYLFSKVSIRSDRLKLVGTGQQDEP